MKKKKIEKKKKPVIIPRVVTSTSRSRMAKPTAPKIRPAPEVKRFQSRNKTEKPSTPKKRPPTAKKCEHEEHKKKHLTLNQRTWLGLYMDTGNASQAAMDAYGLDPATQKESAAQIGWENTHKLSLEIEDLLNEAGLSDVYLMRKLKENLNATKLYGQNAEEHMDGPARNKALEMAFKLKGRLTEKIDMTSKGKELKGSVTVFKLPANGREK